MDTINELKNEDIDQIVDAAESCNTEGVDIRNIKESTVVNENAELEVGTASISEEKDEIDLIAEEFEQISSNVSLFDIGNKEAEEKAIQEHANSEIMKAFDLTNDEAYKVLEVITEMRKDQNYPVYANLPEKVQNLIAKLAYENKAPVTHLNAISRLLMEEFLKDAGVDQALIDLEKAINEAVKMPSLLDLYSEHTKDIMDNKIPETIEHIKDTNPVEAERLEQVRDAFKRSYTFSFAKDMYESNARLRKTIRRWDTEWKRSLEDFNYMNEKTTFKMNDVTEVPDVLSKILIDDPNTDAQVYRDNEEDIPQNIKKLLDLDISMEDIYKFSIMITESCRNLNANDVIDAAYMYYMVRNIVILKHTQEAKTDFSVELINNICDAITFIRDKEVKFNAEHMDKSKSSKKLHSGKKN